MASSMVVAENREHVEGQDGSENFELSPRNHNLLMSLLDETQIDDCDDERLTKVIRSLQEELEYDDRCTSWESDLVECQSSIDESYGQECLSTAMAPDDLDLHWMDVEIVPTSPSWYMDGGANEFSWNKNTFSPNEAEQDCGTLWHGINANFDMNI